MAAFSFSSPDRSANSTTDRYRDVLRVSRHRGCSAESPAVLCGTNARLSARPNNTFAFAPGQLVVCCFNRLTASQRRIAATRFQQRSDRGRQTSGGVRASGDARTPPEPAESISWQWFTWLAAGTSGLRLNDLSKPRPTVVRDASCELSMARTSATRTVLSAVPSLFHSSTPLKPSLAAKKSVPLTSVR